MLKSAAAQRVADAVIGLSLTFKIGERGTYGHMGATLADCVLQAGLNYRTVVLPRVRRILQEYPYATTTSQFSEIVREHGALAVLCWSHQEKPARLERVLSVLRNEGIETEAELAIFMDAWENRQKLFNVNGVGPKTIDYMRLLVGCPTVAVDRHVRRLFAMANVPNDNYDFVREVLVESAELLGVRADLLDAAIWDYFSTAAV